jgi:K+-sensing histidine kinase KdpD
VIQDAVGVHTVAANRSITYDIDCDPALIGHFDVALIERVLHNLIGNASRYCNAKGTIRISARRWHERDPNSCEIVVFNSGPSIPETQRSALFAKYAKGTNGKRGFGLYFCRLACEAHGGAIDYRAGEGGSMFVLQLPGRG